MDQKLLFKYRPDTLAEVTEINRYLTNKVSSFHKQLPDTPLNLQYLSSFEKETSIKAIQDRKTQLREEDVSYYINPMGYREPKPIAEMYNSVGVWGCSYTFGVGVPYTDIYSVSLSDKLKTPVYNFGIPGAGIQKITRSFISNNNFFKFKTAFFVMSSLNRFEYLSFNNYDTPDEIPSDEVSTFDIIPNWIPTHNKALARKGRMLYELHDDAFFLMEFIKNVEMIKQNAEVHGTKVYFSTWCGVTYRLLLKYGISDFCIVQFLENNEDVIDGNIKDFARDGFHPGIRSHKDTANILYDLTQGIIRPDQPYRPKENTNFI